jgi:uncharacterized protein (DUF362 family)/NAD-dependent dihydropyrimidine dehydrogenase PreA subunit
MGPNQQNINTEHARVSVIGADKKNIRPAVDDIIESLDLGAWYGQLRGKTVFVKPNMLGLFAPEKHVTTMPELVGELVRLFQDAGAEVTVGDNCGVGGYGLNKRVGDVTGITKACDGAFVNVAQETEMVPFKSRFMDEIAVSRQMLSADILVSVPKMKTHSLTVVTGAVKNSFGMVAGAAKGRAHGVAVSMRDFGEILSDIYRIRPPDLVVMDAVTAMEGNGPSGGKPKPLGKIIASQNAVALDAVMCKIMGYDPFNVHHLNKSSKRGLGPLVMDDIDLVGNLPDAGRFKLPVTINRYSCIGRFVNERFFKPLSESKLVLDQEKCEQCGICVKGCPAGACVMVDKYPVIDEDKCIRCFCCHELCPEGAWDMRGFFGRFAGWRG